MPKHLRQAALIAVLLAGCGSDPQQGPPQISFDPVFPPLTGKLMSSSSPALADLDGDGTEDIVFGTGLSRVQPKDGQFVFGTEPDPSGYVVAVSGATNRVLWEVPGPRDGFTTARFVDINGDGVPDVVMGGREAMFAAFSGRDGKVIWRVEPAKVARTTVPYNFFTPALVRDLNGDNMPDLVVTYGGDDTRLPNTPRDPGYIAVISGSNGAVLATQMLPDRKESYGAVVSYDRADGEWVIFGTGGETDGGAAFRAPVASLMDGTFSQRVEQLITPGPKGVMSPATLLELTGDEELDIVISTFDGRLIAIDGATGQPLWEQRHANEESYHGPAVLRLDDEGRIGLMLSRGIGGFPRYVGSAHRLYDARDGSVLFEYKDPNYPGGAPLAVDLTGDGIDEPVFFSVRFPSGVGARIHVLHAASGTLIKHDLDGNYWSTPVIADPQKTGRLELIGLSWQQDTNTADWRGVEWQLLRLSLDAAVPATISWGAYMGTRTDSKWETQR